MGFLTKMVSGEYHRVDDMGVTKSPKHGIIYLDLKFFEGSGSFRNHDKNVEGVDYVDCFFGKHPNWAISVLDVVYC